MTAPASGVSGPGSNSPLRARAEAVAGKTCWHCPPGVPVTQLIEGRFKSGRHHVEGRCDVHAEGVVVGNKVLTRSHAAFLVERIRPVDGYETQLALMPSAASRETSVPDRLSCPVTDKGIHVLDPDLRIYMAKSHDGSYWHLIRPAPSWMWLVQKSELREGELICTCESGNVRGWCWRTRQADAWEAEQEDERRWSLPEPQLQAAV